MNTNYTILKAFSGGGQVYVFVNENGCFILSTSQKMMQLPPENGNIFHIGKFKINESVNIRLW